MPDSTTSAETTAATDSVATLKARIKRLQSEKGEVARQFKTQGLTEADRDRLKASMKQVSDALNDAKAELKTALNKCDSEPSSAPIDWPAFTAPLEQDYQGEYRIRRLPADQTAAWASFVHQHPRAHAYHDPAFTRHIETVFGHRHTVLIAESPTGEWLGGLPLVLMRSRLFGAFAVSVPYFNYGGPLCVHRNVFHALVDAARPLLDEETLSHIEVRTLQPNLPLPTSTKKVSMVLPLPTDTDTLDRQVGAKVRAQFKKADSHQPEFRTGGLELLEDFYRVFAENMRDLGTPVYSKNWFKALLSDTQLDTTLVVAYLEQQPVSAGFLLGHKSLLEIPWASTLRRANWANMNMWFYRRILGHAIEQSYRWFDFGRSTVDAGTYQFKKQWGAQPVQHYWYTLSQDGEAVQGTNPDNPKYRLMIAVWRRLPVWLTRLIGPPVIKNVP